MSKVTVTFWSSEAAMVQSALEQQIERYGQSWRKCFIEQGAGIAWVYIPVIREMQAALKKVRRELQEL